MKRTRMLWIALAVAAVVLAAFHFAGAQNSVMAEVGRDIVSSRSAFDTVDIQQAMGLVTFDPPKMLNPPEPIPPLLRYPPSAEDLAKLSGF